MQLQLLVTFSVLAVARATSPSGCVACAAGSLPKKAATAGCVACTAVANSANLATLTCEIATDGVAVKANSVDITAAPVSTTNADSGRKCAVGFFYTAKTASSNATCTACATNCHTCTSATACTKAKVGFYVANPPVACVERTAANCGKGKVPIAKALVCTAGNALAAQLTNANGCTACAAGTIAKGTADGCVACTAVANSATAATLTCELATATADTVKDHSVDITAAAAGAHQGRKCAPGFFHTAKTATSNATCTACATGCHTCTSATACTVPKVGYAVVSSVPKACAQTPLTVCTAHATLKVQNTSNAMCPVLNLCTAINSQTAAAGTVVNCPVPAPAAAQTAGGTSTSSVTSVGIVALMVASVFAF